MVLVVLPSLLAAQAGGQGRFEVDGATVEHALRQLPVADLLIDESGELRRLVNVYVDGADARERGGLDASIEGAGEIRVIAAVAGGFESPRNGLRPFRRQRDLEKKAPRAPAPRGAKRRPAPYGRRKS